MLPNKQATSMMDFARTFWTNKNEWCDSIRFFRNGCQFQGFEPALFVIYVIITKYYVFCNRKVIANIARLVWRHGIRQCYVLKRPCIANFFQLFADVRWRCTLDDNYRLIRAYRPEK